MGISIIAASMILHEHKYKPITGTVLTIGRQSVAFTASEMDQLLRRFQVPKRPIAYQVDETTVGVSRDRAYITQESFFAAFTDARVSSLDVSNYEQAEVVCDLQAPLPRKYRGYADFIFNGSCLDNIFDTAAAIRNMTQLLKPNGRVYSFEQGNSHPTAYLKYSADWFMDYYALNQFEDCKTYIVSAPNSLGTPLIPGAGATSFELPRRSPYEQIVYSYNPYVENAGGPGYDCSSVELFSRYEIHCIAEKGRQSSYEHSPIQKHYRTDRHHKAICTLSAHRFLKSARPLFGNDVTFDAATVPKIDSSDYPEQMRAVAVLSSGYP
jgi:SAM-dependent methyltransferase